MKVQMVPVPGKNPGVNIQGPHVTSLVWHLFSYSINSNRMDCPWYKARIKAGAFFQGGSFSDRGEWVFIEFWKPTQAEDYLNLINAALVYVTDDGKPKRIHVKDPSNEMHKWVIGLTSFYDTQATRVNDGWIIDYIDAMQLTTIVEKSLQNPGVFSPFEE